VTELDGVRVVITNRHVVQEIHRLDVTYADGVEATGLVVHRSRTLDVAVVAPAQDVHVPPLPVGHRPLVRGERVVLAGHPGGMRFITSEGVVAGVAERIHEYRRRLRGGRASSR
jgi:S1-C subfamily serine protease